MSVHVHEAFSLDSFQDRLLWFDDFHGDQIKDEWNSTGDGGGSAAVVDAQTGGIVRLTSNAAFLNSWVLDWNDIRTLHVSKKVSMEVRAKLNQTATMNMTIRLGFDANNFIRFAYDTFLLANWITETMDGGANTQADTGVTPDTNYHIFRIECFPTGEVHFYIDDTETANSPMTTNIPDDAGDFLQPSLEIWTYGVISNSVDIDYCYARQER